MSNKKIQSALISVFHKEGLEPIIQKLNELGVEIYSTGGTQKYIEERNIPVTAVEELTDFPEILGGRVKTLHPKVFGGILARRDEMSDQNELAGNKIPEIDLVIVDLYPFEKTVETSDVEQEIIEKIDIGGIALIRATAKNFKDTLIVPSRNHYDYLLNILENQEGKSSLEDRKYFATQAFNISSHYDTAIFNYFNKDSESPNFKASASPSKELRYGENPHQNGFFHGNLNDIFEILHEGKALSYNNLLDIDAAVNLIHDFDETTFAVLKHNNACGIASRNSVFEAWKVALAGDPVSAFGGILISNATIDLHTAEDIDKIFYEVLIAPDFEKDALELLKKKKKRIVLKQKEKLKSKKQFRSLLNGVIEQDKDLSVETKSDLKNVTTKKASDSEIEDLIFAKKLVKHTKSNAIILAKNKQLIGSGTGQTSRIDALNQAIQKAKAFQFDVSGAVMASDAFFPFPDCVEVAHLAGITAVIQPGGSIRDQDSIDYCNQNNMAMITTGVRHFKH